jgi:hypothetical protein
MDGVDLHWRRRREELARFAEEVSKRGAWFGNGGEDCPECEVEERSAEDGRGVRIETVDHTHWVEDKRLEQRLQDAARIWRAERDGSIRIGVLPPGWRG